jgi:hypothetical protein
VDVRLHAAHRGLAAGEAVQGREFEPEVGPIHHQLVQVERGPEAAAGVEGHPTEVRPVREPKQVGTPEGEHPEAREHCH